MIAAETSVEFSLVQTILKAESLLTLFIHFLINDSTVLTMQ